LDTVLHGRYRAARRLSEQGCTKDQEWSWCKGWLGAHPIYNQSVKLYSKNKGNRITTNNLHWKEKRISRVGFSNRRYILVVIS
jgi:hypothetical protein